jgi:murein DD-endopeptidase MepM/ murein hydrolase activator NlpD
MSSWIRALGAVLGILLASTAMAQRTPLQQSFDMRVPWTPEPVSVHGKTFLQYELHLTNFAPQPLTLQRVSVMDDQGQELATLDGDALNHAVRRAGTNSETERTQISPGVDAVVYLTVPLHGSVAAPLHLSHRAAFVAAESTASSTVDGAALTVQPATAPELGPPLRGGPWVAIYDASWERGHRRVLYAVNGSVHVPGRFAIDWIRVGPQGGFARGGGKLPSQWLGYGADVLAVTDAVVASTGEGIVEPGSLAEGAAHKVPLENAAGNYVALDLGNGRYAFYEHLKPGSITVKAGQHVRRGEVIGKLGYTGESTGPHLHFHVSDANTPLAAEGLPYGLNFFRVLGAYASIEAFAEGHPWQPLSVVDIRHGELPAPLSVVNFDNATGP